MAEHTDVTVDPRQPVGGRSLQPDPVVPGRNRAVRRPSGPNGPAWPGLLVVAAAAAAALGVAALLPQVNASTVGVVLGALLVNSGLHRPALRPGTRFAAKRLLRLAVVLLGLQLSVSELVALGLGGAGVVAGTVAVTFVGTRLLGRLLGVSPARSLLVATGFSICGASAVAAMEPVAGGDEEDTGVAIALVTLCGSLAIVVLPALRGALHLDPVAFGQWVGASVHDVGQTVATADRVPGALRPAVVVKLSRVVLLAPLVAGEGLLRYWGPGRVQKPFDSSAGGAGSTSTAGEGEGRRCRPAVLPLFVAGFLAAVGVASTGWVPARALAATHGLQQVLLVAALVGLGTGIHLPSLRRTGGRVLVLGLVSWILVAGTSYAGVRLLGR